MNKLREQMAEALATTMGGVAWGSYREAVGGKALNGDDLPDWDALLKDPTKEKVVLGWKAAAMGAIAAFHELEKE